MAASAPSLNNPKKIGSGPAQQGHILAHAMIVLESSQKREKPLVCACTFCYHSGVKTKHSKIKHTMNYLGYTSRIEFDERDNIFVGRVLGIRAIISFHGETVAELRTAFNESMDDYLKDCGERGLTPEKPASGKLMLRVPPEVHGAALVAAQAAGMSLNAWAAQALREAAHA